jgi:hypothetical protein
MVWRKEMELLKRVQELLRTKDVKADFNDDGELNFLARTDPISVRIRITATDQSIVVCAHIPLFVPANRRRQMTEAISLANWQLRFARFEMDADDGELHCRSDLPLYDGNPTDQQLTRLMSSVWANTDRYACALVEVMTGQSEPATAIARVEGRRAEPLRRLQEKNSKVN